MNDEIKKLLEELVRVQKEALENQKKVLDYVRVQQKQAFKKMVIALIVVFVLLFLVQLI